MKQIVKKIPLKTFVILFFVINTLLFFYSFQESGNFMKQFEGNNTKQLAYGSYLVSYLFGCAIYGGLFYYLIKKQKWAYILLLVFFGLAIIDVVYDFAMLGYVKSVSQTAYDLVSKQINIPVIIFRKSLSLMVFMLYTWYIVLYWKLNHPKTHPKGN